MKMLMLKFKPFFYIAAYALLFGCGSTSQKDQVADAVVAPELVETGQFLPKQEYDDKISSYIPYEAKENPYLSLSGRIKKEAVTKFIEARRAFKKKQYDQVDLLLNEVVAIEPGLSGPWVMRGNIALDNDDLEAAKVHFGKAIEINEKNINAYLPLAKIQRELGQFIEAQNTYAKALSVWPDFPEAHLNLGILYDLYLNKPAQAQKHMEAYVFLVKEPTQKVSVWLNEIRQRTGLEPSFADQAQETDGAASVNEL